MALGYLKKICIVILVDFCVPNSSVIVRLICSKLFRVINIMLRWSPLAMVLNVVMTFFQSDLQGLSPLPECFSPLLMSTLLFDFRIMVILTVAFLAALLFGILMYRKKREAQCASATVEGSTNGRAPLVSMSGIKSVLLVCMTLFFVEFYTV